ncbi:MAG: hypothetical protein P4M14_11855 [Gammaproteobacteria bacterium]|nr:hypothetical protein [Gammaproteobacteria bacterium]
MNTIPPSVFSDFVVETGNKKVAVLTDNNSVEMIAALTAHLKKEFSTENWDFVKRVQALNMQAVVTPAEFAAVINEFVKPGVDRQVNLKSEICSVLMNKYQLSQTNPAAPMKMADFTDAVQEILMLMKRDSLPRFVADPETQKASQRDNNKALLQLTARQVLENVNQYASQSKLIEPTENKSLASSFMSYLSGSNQKQDYSKPFETSLTLAKVMKSELTALLLASDKMSYKDFSEQYFLMVNRNARIQAEIAKNVDGKVAIMLTKGGNDLIGYSTLQEQVAKLKQLKSGFEKEYQFSPANLETTKKEGIEKCVKDLDSVPVVDVAEVRVMTRPRS